MTIDKEYTSRLENVIKQMLTPLRNIPFNLVIETLTGKKVLAFDKKISDHAKILLLLEEAAIKAGNKINEKGILRPRPNEVGNDIEIFVKEALNLKKLNANTPIGKSGNKKAMGYPDVLFWYNEKPYYLECKTYNAETINTTQRSFYFSPAEDFKVTHDATHFLLSFEIYVAGERGNKHIYKTNHYKILSIETLTVDVKYEFNSDNKRMYSTVDGTKLLAEGDL